MNKITNLKRLNFKNKILVLFYLLKRVLNIKPSKEETDIYFLYMLIITSDGFIKKENNEFYIIEFRNSHILKLRKSPSSDILVYNQVYGYKEYEIVAKTYKRNFAESKNNPINIIDAGGNIGLSSIYFLQEFDEPNIIIIEPENKNFENLNFNLKSFENVIKIKGGLWYKNCRLKIVNDFRDKSDWAFRVEESDDGDIDAFSIDFLINEYKFEYIDILKIDIEGAEKEIFSQPISKLDFLSKTKCIAIEIHEEFKCQNQILQILEKFGFELIHEQETTIGVNKNLLEV